ncbi:NAD-dependent DNA ligase LigA [Mycoplasma zalophidermidis]|uniref:DNA ligase n=1 Tax=Mycoplasma zalophidermidis TaxID=398174 RepID=A0ABS6DS52_9MOLU|nr:NAD-dependent DNA ligase LigA [Mycoplasma zalophidermidis]MBU4689761.1 NAD-dependent DNA ligase LigA [Mycoplasma zalophidermidis]MBU4693727.1 NAD-dependent DNA ligase LigA [Mycoplasma zalophidermidis]MCR8966608.1 NAD-dependent DNA ligase LigA [Mycoplasma zalophidermidis]
MKRRIQELTTLINKWNQEYFIDNNPSVSDLEYDKALKELEQLELQYPELKHPQSPTNHVGSGMNIYNSKFTKVTHKQPMLSLSKAYNYDEIIKYINNIEKNVPFEYINFSVEPKIDGLSISLHYKNGYLVQALTRGNGIEGEDVTENIMQIKSIPHIINYKKDLEVRGEVFLPKTKFVELNSKMSILGEKTFANPRNAASGTLRQLDSDIVAQRGLQSFLYELVQPELHGVNTQQEALEFMNGLNIPTNPLSKVVETEELEEEIEQFAEIKNKLDYDADGLVIKLNNLKYWVKLGKTAKFPKHSIAFKYEVESATSIITNIVGTVGRTGKITYVANLEPVVLNQTTVQNATMHNYNFIQDMNVDIGDEVTIVKAGEIIPKVIDIVSKNSLNVFPKILNCPSCNSMLVEHDDIVDQFCPNEECPDVNINKIYHFSARESLNIKGLGLSTVKDFYKNGIIKCIEDIFKLETKVDQILELPRYGSTKVNNLLNSIQKSLNSDFDKVLFALGIKHVGARAAKLISNKYNNFSELIDDKELLGLTYVENIGPKIIESIIEYLKSGKNVELLRYLDSVFNYKKQSKIISTKLSNLTFVITGKLSENRDFYSKIIENNGGNVSSSVSSKTSYLLCGDDAGSKKDKAIQLGITILNEQDFNNLLK